MKKSKEYNTPLRSRKDMAAYILGVTNQRYYQGHHPLCFNVKLYRLNFDFDHLWEVFQKTNELDTYHKTDEWLKAAREVYDDTGEEKLYEYGVNGTVESFLDREQFLVNGTKVKAEFSFEGRSGGWLSLNKFQGENLCVSESELKNYMEGKYPEEKMDFNTLRQLYQFVVQLNVETKKASEEVEFRTADTLFNNLCVDLPQPDRIQLKLNFDRKEAS